MLSIFFSTDGSGTLVHHLPSYGVFTFSEQFTPILRKIDSVPLVDLLKPSCEYHDVPTEVLDEFKAVLELNGLLE
ncbi:hypothetical protein ACOJR9_13400 [Alteromonas sp. A081]|uniref:hypothetical protein n=1 Tax=Alteromonas sp. A081 TaxID=3410269 RepID=UPI003B982F5A